MLVALAVFLIFGETAFDSTVDRALVSARNHQWNTAMAELDRAHLDHPLAFETNNFYYLRGRIAAQQNDWARALDDFTRIGKTNALRPMAIWHAADAAIQLGAAQTAEQMIDELPSDFPSGLMIQLAQKAPRELALKILDRMNTREARLQRALLRSDIPALWVLLRERNSDDAGLQSARRLVPVASTSMEWRDLGNAFLAQRQFADATAAYTQLSEDPNYAAESHYQLARIHFLNEDYEEALDAYRAVVDAFPGTDWEKDAEYQVANSYWRLRRYAEAEKAFLKYLSHSPRKTVAETATRDLVDVYRSLGQNDKAIALIDRSLANKVSAGTRQVLLFTKVKILYSQQKFSSALTVIRQLKGSNLQVTSGGPSSEELIYLEALCLSKTGNAAAAKAAWQRLAARPASYYGQRAAKQLGNAPPIANAGTSCETDARTREGVVVRLQARRRPLLTEAPASTDLVTELMFLELWDEASVWIDQVRRPDASLAADLSYASSRYNRAIIYADRLPASSTIAPPLQYPAGFQSLICQAAAENGVDPLWLQAIIWQESKYNPAAQSGAAARGLMQFIPDTAEAIAAAAGITGLTVEKLYEPETSIRLGAYYWSKLMAEFKSPELALAAYNGGPANVRRWKDKWPGSDNEFFVSEIGFTETKRYVQAVFEARAAYGRLN